ncbi:MAG: hypothetical protein QOE31_1966 [Solirubrobacteraceae bacterium]|nr:hypothetical protein [Solirubrobacteraceae bacterium]
MSIHAIRRLPARTLGALALALVIPAPAHAVATIAADTTRSSSGDPLVAGRSTTIRAGGADQALLRFRVQGLGAPPATAILRLRVTDATVESLAVRALPPVFGEDDGTPAPLAPEPAVIATRAGVQNGTWAEWDVTAAVHGDGDVGLQVSGPLLDPASFSSREGPDAPQLVVTPDDATAAELASRLDPRNAPTRRIGAKDDLGHTLDGLDVALSPDPAAGRYLGVYHSWLGGRFLAQLATSPDLVTWTHRADLAEHSSQLSIAVDPAGGIVIADELDAPDAQYVSSSSLRLRHYASVAKLIAGQQDAERVLSPRVLAPTAEGTPQVTITRWGSGPADSDLRVTFHYFRNIDVDRQAIGTLTNFTTWNASVDTATNTLLEAFGVRGALGDRSDISYGGRAFGVVEGQLVKNDHRTWRIFLVDRTRGQARMVAAKLPAGGYSLGNPSLAVLPGPAGSPVLFESVFAFSEGAPTESGSAITVTPLQ